MTKIEVIREAFLKSTRTNVTLSVFVNENGKKLFRVESVDDQGFSFSSTLMSDIDKAEKLFKTIVSLYDKDGRPQ